MAEQHTDELHTKDSRTDIVSSGLNSTQHWDNANTISYCTKGCGYSAITSSNVQVNLANHTANPNSWVDAGHVGTKHYYDNFCTKPACNNYRFRWRVINCPGGSNHIAPNSVVLPTE